jgi:hypothetical protein
MLPLTSDFRLRCRSQESSEGRATGAALFKESSPVRRSILFSNENGSGVERMGHNPIQDGSFVVGRGRSRFFSSSRFPRPTRVNQGLQTGIVPALGGYAVFVGTSRN